MFGIEERCNNFGGDRARSTRSKPSTVLRSRRATEMTLPSSFGRFVFTRIGWSGKRMRDRNGGGQETGQNERTVPQKIDGHTPLWTPSILSDSPSINLSRRRLINYDPSCALLLVKVQASDTPSHGVRGHPLLAALHFCYRRSELLDIRQTRAPRAQLPRPSAECPPGLQSGVTQKRTLHKYQSNQQKY